MTPNPTTPSSTALVAALPTIWSLITQGLAIAAVVFAFAQSFDLEYSAKEVKTKLHYKGNFLFDLTKPHDK